MTFAHRIPTAALALGFAAALAAPALAGDVRPPNNADVGGSSTGGSISLPGTSDIDAPDIRTTMEEKRKRDDQNTVSSDVVNELRDMAKEAGQSSSSADDKN